MSSESTDRCAGANLGGEARRRGAGRNAGSAVGSAPGPRQFGGRALRYLRQLRRGAAFTRPKCKSGDRGREFANERVSDWGSGLALRAQQARLRC